MASTAIPRRQIFVRPRSEIITVLDWQQVSNERPEQWRSETSLDSEFFESEERKIKTGYVCGSYEFTRERLEESDSEILAQEGTETEIPENGSEKKRSVLNSNLKPAKGQVRPRLVKAQSLASLPRKVEYSSSEPTDTTQKRNGINRRKGSLDISLAKLRHEMNSLRRQDMELLEQLLNLNNSIQDFKLSQHASFFDASDESDDPDIATEQPLKQKRWHSRGSLGSDLTDRPEITMDPKGWHSRRSLSSDEFDQREEAMQKPLKPKRWHSRGSLSYDQPNHPEKTMAKPPTPKRWRSRGSLGSDESDQPQLAMQQPLKSKRWSSRGSLGSDGSDYHSASSRSSFASGSNPSLCGSDIASYDSGHESGAGLKSCRRRSKGRFGSGDLRRVSFGTVRERSGSEVFLNGSEVVFPAQAVRRNSDFRVAEIKSIGTLSKRQSTIW